MNISEIMHDRPVRIEPNASLGDALKLMAEHNCRHLAVMEGPQVVGIISDRDLALYYDPMNMTPERWEQRKVRDLMTKNPTAIGSHAPFNEAANILLKEGFSALLIIDNGELVGIVTDRDFVRYCAGQSD